MAPETRQSDQQSNLPPRWPSRCCPSGFGTLAQGRWRVPAYAAVRRDPRSPMSVTAEQTTHPTQDWSPGSAARRLGRRRGYRGHRRPGSDQHCHLVHVTFSRPTGCTHPKLVRGVSRDQPGPSSSRNRSLKSSGSTRGPCQRFHAWIAHVAQISALERGTASSKEGIEMKICCISFFYLEELILLSFQSIPIHLLQAFGAGAYFERN